MYYRFFCAVLLSAFFLTSCDDDNQVGSLVQPEEDLLEVYSNMVDVTSSSILTDSVLSKSEYFILGRYTDKKLGETNAEYMSQLDARIGISIPDTTVVTSSSSQSGILNTLLTSIDSNFGNILSITSPSNVAIDSAVFIIQYSDDFFGDSTAMQAVSVYELNNPLLNQKYYTNTKVSDYCNSTLLLGSTTYQIQNSREIRIPLTSELGTRLAKLYMNGTKITSQSEFNDQFKGVYVSHAFNEGSVINVTVSGIQIYYKYDALIKTTYEGRDTVINSSELKTSAGNSINPLVSSIFLSANKSVQSVNMISHNGFDAIFNNLQSEEMTYTYTPAGMYTAVNIPFATVMDSIKKKVDDTTKVMFNSVKLILHREDLNWDTDLTSNVYLLLMKKDNIVSFFYNNEVPDGYTSFVSTLDTVTNTYSFSMTAASQNKLNGKSLTYSDDMVLVPVTVSYANSNYSYRQQLWLTSTMLYGDNATDTSLRPRLDVIYTRRYQ